MIHRDVNFTFCDYNKQNDQNSFVPKAFVNIRKTTINIPSKPITNRAKHLTIEGRKVIVAILHPVPKVVAENNTRLA